MTTTHGLLGQVITPDHPEYEDARRLWNGAIDKRPAFISRCRDAHEVAAAVRFAVRHDLPLAVRGGGHSIPGHSACDGGLIIDLGLMKDRRLAGDVVHVGPGVLWAELDATTQAVGRGIPGGEISDTGVAGLTLGGGVGWLSRTYGLACDNLLEAEVVLADGSIVTTSDDKDPDLIWGLRGGGGNFGVVTRFTFRLNPIPVPMFAGFVMHPIAHARDGLRLLLDIAKDAPDGLGLAAAFIGAPPAPFVPEELHFTPVVALAAAYVGPSAEGAELVRPLRELEAPIADLFGEMPYTVLQSMFDAGAPRGLASYASCEWLDPLDDSGIDAFVSIAEAATSPLSQTLLRVTGGVMSRIPEDATAFRHRGAASMATVAAMWPDPSDPGESHKRWTRDALARLQPWSAGGGYVNHLGDEGADRVRQAYGPNWKRLVELKRRVDPTNVFALNQNISPA